MNPSKTVLVTGGSGFIGTNLCKRLLLDGKKVIAVDNAITGSLKNAASLQAFGDFTFLQHNITDPFPKNASILKDVSSIFHLACPTGVDNLLRLGEEMLLTSSLGTKHVLELARETNSSLVFTSSSEVYGNPEESPQTEDYSGNVDPIGLRSPYEEGKRFAESLVMLFIRKYGLNAKIVRIFNTYGPYMTLSDSRVIPSFVKHIQEQKPLPIKGDGSQKRTFCYVDDLVEGLFLVDRLGDKGEVFNLGSDRQISIKDLASLFISLRTDTKGVSYIDRPKHDHDQRLPSLEKISSLGWKQEVSLNEGLNQTLLWYGL